MQAGRMKGLVEFLFPLVWVSPVGAAPAVLAAVRAQHPVAPAVSVQYKLGGQPSLICLGLPQF